MATISQVEAGLDSIAERINSARATMSKVQSNALGASEALAAITTDFADVIATVQAYGTSNAYDAATKAKFTKMVTEYNDLKTIADQVAGISV